ncbi:CLUMA_CG009427, isoform A [Clunio marinus]|uniref:CLUMA_CG009427, isoform A n=1 Tax=Clunio marinus TaxID=568069 RepID=A0A1J1I8C6_9DIPT|nr:CLUMA_CG009427, isoform A [Clunio marinus]
MRISTTYLSPNLLATSLYEGGTSSAKLLLVVGRD